MLIETTQFHHHPSAAINYPVEVAVIHLANNIANSIETVFSIDDDIPINNSVWIILNCDESKLTELTEESISTYQQTVDLIYHKKSA